MSIPNTCCGTDISLKPSGHAFILRRFDTGAISLTTMYRAAFPGATDADEKKEVAWVKDQFAEELLGNNGSTREPQIIRLAGTWVGAELALHFAETYQLGDIIALMANAEPDPKATYRRSSKATPKGKGEATASSVGGLPTPSPTMATPSAAKRRKESSPAPSSKAASPPPRRSSRIKSPAPDSMPSITSITSPKSTKKPRRGAAAAISNGFSDDTVVGDDAEIAAMAGPDMNADIEEQRELITKLKAQRALDNETLIEVDEKKPKRVREEEEGPLTFEFKEPEVGERAVVTNRRVGRFNMEPRTKSVAWGVAAFAIGMGAM